MFKKLTNTLLLISKVFLWSKMFCPIFDQKTPNIAVKVHPLFSSKSEQTRDFGSFFIKCLTKHQRASF